jgi:CRP/FNR family transcriptional regulator, cyclic AMP receptor protein
MGIVINFQLLANAGFPLERFASGRVIFDEGSEGDKMYVVHSGEVTIERAGKVIEALSAGDIFGEMALIDGARRSATARAKTDCRVAPITEKAFLLLVHETPLFALTVMRTLANRLRRANERK